MSRLLVHFVGSKFEVHDCGIRVATLDKGPQVGQYFYQLGREAVMVAVLLPPGPNKDAILDMVLEAKLMGLIFDRNQSNIELN